MWFPNQLMPEEGGGIMPTRQVHEEKKVRIFRGIALSIVNSCLFTYIYIAGFPPNFTRIVLHIMTYIIAYYVDSGLNLNRFSIKFTNYNKMLLVHDSIIHGCISIHLERIMIKSSVKFCKLQSCFPNQRTSMLTSERITLEDINGRRASIFFQAHAAARHLLRCGELKSSEQI